MRNIQLLQRRNCKLLPLHFISHDKENNTIWGIIDDYLCGYHHGSNSLVLKEKIQLEEQSKCVGFNVIPQLSSLCWIYESGQIFTYLFASKEVECVGVIDNGIYGVSWSPDYELVAFVTGKMTLLLMTKEWDVICEQELPILESDQSETVSIQCEMSWRGDGNYIACIISNGSTTKLTVWDRSGTLCSTGETCKGMGYHVSWRPSGNIIATSQLLPQKHDVIFFERNGLRHGEFTLRYQNATVTGLSWNLDSDLLAVSLTTNDNSNIIQIWSMSNYHWFIKQEFKYDKKVTQIEWDSELAFNLYVLCEDGNYFEYSFCWDYDVFNEIAVCGNIDGNKLLLTPLKYMLVPPPLSATDISVQHNINAISFSPKLSIGALLLSDNSISFIENSDINKNIPYSNTPIIKGKLTFEDKAVGTIRQLLWKDDNTLYLLLNESWHEDRIMIVSFEFKDKEEQVIIKSQFSVTMQNKIIKIFKNYNGVYLETNNGEIYKITEEGETKEIEIEKYIINNNGSNKLSSLCPWIKSATYIDILNDTNLDLIIGIDNRAKLLCNDVIISTDCNSFTIIENFLIYTTLTNNIKFLRFQQLIDIINNTNNNNNNNNNLVTGGNYDFSNREIERGSRIVSVVGSDSKVVLQLPRGNLEGIYPRILCLDAIRSLIDSMDYKNAFLQARRHRIDFNLLVDHNPSQFLLNLNTFVSQLNSVDFLNLFISSLNNSNVTTTMYTVSNGKTNNHNSVFNNSNKVNLICDKLREVIDKIDSKKYLLCKITTYVKKEPAELEDVLHLIRNLKENENEIEVMSKETKNNNEGTYVTADGALKYVCWLVDVDKLYDVALGMYDFDLVMMVAQKSQKDPKEYIPYINQLKQLEKFYQRYTIDMHLNRFSKALNNLSQAGEDYFEQCRDLMKQKELYEEAVSIYTNKKEKEKLTTIQLDYGDYLAGKSKLLEAGLVYLNGNHLLKAVNAFKGAGEWKFALATAYKLGYTKDEIKQLAYSVVDVLLSTAKYDEAAFLLETYCDDIEQALSNYIQSMRYQDALRSCYLHQRIDLIDTVLLPSVLEAFEFTVNSVQESYDTYLKQSTRLEIVKATKLLMPKLDDRNISSEVGSVMSGISNMSDLSTVTDSTRSSMSGSSLLSKKSKTKKPKKVKKRISGKEGSQFEDEYLIASLKRLIPTQKNQESVGELIKMLVYFNQREMAVQLQKQYSDFLTLVSNSMHLFVTSTRTDTTNQATNESIILQQQQEPTKAEIPNLLPSVNWKLNLFNDKNK